MIVQGESYSQVGLEDRHVGERIASYLHVVQQPLTELREAVLVGLAKSGACRNRILGHGDTRGDDIILVVEREHTGGRRVDRGGQTSATSMDSVSARHTGLDLLMMPLGLLDHVTNFTVHPDDRLNLLVSFPAWQGSTALQRRSRPASIVRRGQCYFSARLAGAHEGTIETATFRKPLLELGA